VEIDKLIKIVNKIMATKGFIKRTTRKSEIAYNVAIVLVLILFAISVAYSGLYIWNHGIPINIK